MKRKRQQRLPWEPRYVYTYPDNMSTVFDGQFFLGRAFAAINIGYFEAACYLVCAVGSFAASPCKSVSCA